MTAKALSLENVLRIADAWSAAGGLKKIEIGALEPLLWRDGRYKIHDMVSALTNRGFLVSLTTNGQLLELFASELRAAGLSLLRTSWHSMNPVIFREISGGYGDHEKFLRGVTLALEAGIPVAFNRVLHRGYTDDIPAQLEYIEAHGSRLKLYTLMWTPESAGTHSKYAQDWRPIVREWILPRTSKITRKKSGLGRDRLQFHLERGAMVEVKLGDTFLRDKNPCSSCSFRDRCEEGFGDYVRVDPRLHAYFCYMRRDLGFSLLSSIEDKSTLESELREKLGNSPFGSLLAAPLRLTVAPYCNFNCRAPGASSGWCMEHPGDYKYPPIKRTVLEE